MRQKRIAAIQPSCNRVELVSTECDVGVFARKCQVRTVITAGNNTVEFVIINPFQIPAARRITVNPFSKLCFQQLLSALCKHGFLFVDNAALFVVNNNGIAHLGGFKVQTILQDCVTVTLLDTVLVDGFNGVIIKRLVSNVVTSHHCIELYLNRG